jgi:hypothetical protein
MNRLRLLLASIQRRWGSLLSNASKNSPESPAQNDANPNARKTLPITRAIIEIPNSVITEYRRTQKEQAADTQRNYKVALGGLGVAFILAAIGIYQSCKTQEAVLAANRSANAEVAAIRAWVKLTIRPVPFNTLSNNSSFEHCLQNIGKTPASNLEMTDEFIPMKISKVTEPIKMPTFTHCPLPNIRRLARFQP